jgi:LacI family transcriptional regulator
VSSRISKADRAPKAVTIKDLARHAGVSSATVSRVINDSGYVSEATREKVENAITELGYQPDTRARELRGKPSRLIALIIPNIQNVFYTTLAEAVEQDLRGQNFTMVLGVTQEDPELFIDYLESFWQRRVDGILYVPPDRGDYSKAVRNLASAGVPMVEVNRRSQADLLDGVVADNFRGAYLATEYLLGFGHRRIALIVGSREITTGKDRIQGYERALRDAEVPVRLEYLKSGRFIKEFAVGATEELLALDERPTAIFAASNRLVMGTMSVLMEHKIDVPGDISVISFDDVEWLRYFNPPITTVDIAIEEMAALSIQLLLRRSQERPTTGKPRTYSLSTMLIERKSCRPLLSKERE